MNVIFLLPALPEHPRTGGEIYNSHLIKGLRARGWTVEVLCLPDIHRQPLFGGSRAFYRLLKGYRGPARVAIYDTWLYRWLWPVMALLRARTSLRFISFAQLCYWDTYASARARAMRRALTWAALLPAHRHIAVSRTILREDLGPFYTERTGRVVYPGCDWAGMELPRADCARLPGQILSVGNYAERKGFHILIEALAQVSAREPELGKVLSLRLVGNLQFGPAYVARLREQIEAAGLSGRVFLDDWRSRDALSQLMGDAQLFAFASASEGFGMVVVEAMLHGLPVLLSDFSVATELLGENREAGYIVGGRDAAAFADAMVDYFTRRDRLGMGAQARARGQALASTWDRVVEQFEAIITETASLS